MRSRNSSPTKRPRKQQAKAGGGRTRFPGHLRAEAPLHETALHLLIKHYDDYQPFVDDCARVRSDVVVAPEPTSREAIDLILRARDVTRALAKRWNLDCIPHFREHDYWHLRQAVDQVGRQFGHITGRPFSPISTTKVAWEPEYPEIVFEGRRWSWGLGAFETLGELRDRVADGLDVVPSNLPPEVVEQLWSLPDQARSLQWKLVDLPHNLPTHVRWLFLRLCPQPDMPLSVSRIVELDDQIVDERTVRRGVNKAATAIGIQLPPLRPGRPRRNRHFARST